MKLASTTGDFAGYAKTTAVAVRFYEETGFRHLDYNFGACDEHIAPCMGTTDMDAVMQGLLAVGYKGYFTFEAGNMLLSYGRWPHRRRQAPSVTERRLSIPPLELRRKAASLLYEIGRAILTAYDCFEE